LSLFKSKGVITSQADAEYKDESDMKKDIRTTVFDMYATV